MTPMGERIKRRLKGHTYYYTTYMTKKIRSSAKSKLPEERKTVKILLINMKNKSQQSALRFGQICRPLNNVRNVTRKTDHLKATAR